MTSSVIAYLDPGTGSLILQVLVGGVAGIAVTFKLWWSRVTSLFRRKPSEETPESEAS
jgi:hypothetical protein